MDECDVIEEQLYAELAGVGPRILADRLSERIVELETVCVAASLIGGKQAVHRLADVLSVLGVGGIDAASALTVVHGHVVRELLAVPKLVPKHGAAVVIAEGRVDPAAQIGPLLGIDDCGAVAGLPLIVDYDDLRMKIAAAQL